MVAAGKERIGLGKVAAAATVLAVVSGALLIGGRAAPSPDHPRTRRWYKRLDKPGFTPPGAAFGIAWTTIQATQAWGGYRLLRQPASADRTAALACWAANQAGVAGWSEIFFGQRKPGAGTLASVAMAGSAVGYMTAAARVDRQSALAGAPLVAWLGFATLLAEEVWRRNPDA